MRRLVTSVCFGALALVLLARPADAKTEQAADDSSALPVQVSSAVGGLLFLGIALTAANGGGRGPAPSVEVSGDDQH